MAYFKPNLGRRYTNSRTIACILSGTVDTGTFTPPMTVQFREGTNDWSPLETVPPIKFLELSEDIGDKTIECRFVDSLGADFTISYTITLIEDTERTAWHTTTQDVANNLPNWHPGRRLRASNWQTFINPIGGAVGIVNDKIQDVSDSVFLSSAPINEIDQVGVVLVDPAKAAATKVDTNLVRNPTFALMTQPFGEPDYWAVSGDTLWDISTAGLFGRQSMTATPGVNEGNTIIQEILVELNEDEPVTSTVYYKTPNTPVPTAVPAAVDYHHRLVALYEDGTTQVVSGTLNPETDDVWFASTLTLTPTKAVTRLFLVVHVDHITALGTFSTTIGGASVYRGPKEKDFSIGLTHPRFFEGPSAAQLEATGDLWLTESPVDFWDKAIPTRVSPHTVGAAGVYTAPTSAPTAFSVRDALRQSHNIGYLADTSRPGNSDQVAMYETSSDSLIALYDVALYKWGAGHVKVPEFAVEAVTFFNNRLWAVCSWDNSSFLVDHSSIDSYGSFGSPFQAGDTIKTRYLVVLEHRTPAEQTDYMEAIQVLPLINLATNNPIVRIWFSEDDPQWVYFWTSTQEYYSRLYYDYGLVRTDSVWLREVDSMTTVI